MNAPAIRRTEEGQLLVHQEEQPIAVSLRPCFPWSFPESFLSLRDKDGKEVLLIESLESLDSESRSALQDALAESRFTLEIHKIHSIERNFEMRIWKVDTNRGARTFEIRLDDWPRKLPGGGIAIVDLAGDLYTIQDQEQLDPTSRKLLFAYAD